jgi:hypothetical protein
MCCVALGTPSSFYIEAAPNLSINVDKGLGKEHCSRTLRLNFSNVAVRYTNADAIAAAIGRQARAEATQGIFLIVVPQLVLKGSLAGRGPRSHPNRLRNIPLVKDFDTVVVETPNARNVKTAS